MKCFLGWMSMAAAIFFTREAEARGPLGLGIIVGSPTGVSLKYNAGNHAIDGALAWNWWGGLHIHSDYLFTHPSSLDRGSAGGLGWYVGLGGSLNTWESGRCHSNWCDSGGAALGFRVPIGLNFDFSSVPIEIFGEVAPVLYLVPGTGLGADLGIGIRFYL